MKKAVSIALIILTLLLILFLSLITIFYIKNSTKNELNVKTDVVETTTKKASNHYEKEGW